MDPKTKTPAPIIKLPIKICSLEELTRRIEIPLLARIELGSATVTRKVVDPASGLEVESRSILENAETLEIECRRLPSSHQERLNGLRRTLLPPVKDKGKPTESYDYQAPAYLAAKEQMERRIRSMTIYEGCPVIKAGKPGLGSAEEIHGYISSLPLTENIIDVLYYCIEAGGVRLPELVSFISPPDLARN